MGEVPSELTLRSVSSTSSLGESTPPRPRPFDVFIETTTQMLATPRLQERLLLALEAIVHSFGFQQAAVAIVNEPFVRKFFHGGNPIGRRIRIESPRRDP